MNHLPDFISRARGALFDLDGVIVDTAKYHYLAWKRLANELRFDFTEADNERLKGVSRMRSLDILLELGKFDIGEALRERMSILKDNWYVEYISHMTQDEILPGAREYIQSLREQGVRIALGSASRNAPLILDKLHITDLFDAVIDGNSVTNAKPDPEVFLRGAKSLGLQPGECVVYEDAEAGVEAAHRAGMKAVGIGTSQTLPEADYIISGLHELVGKSVLQER
ncbi:beta-phosphoglucomutase [Ruficoccus amylovorans]|uniref:Beta-phosphoglucomutase n=1 Tax=Ruficoccus amylovorans TaxID=1804625 RepID=A0A842HHY8_9BACT|nr:beta-phosphoglucomutase [Ruficoccus amylovorans]MBC2595216.1 beta-phosphoglucomutase [Ruficoccus amylovorans]